MNKEYIEREILIKQFSGGDEMKSLSESIHDSRFLEAINKVPTADVKPIVRGRWYDEDCFDRYGSPIYRCSVCNKTVADDHISEHKHCLHCGAEMEEPV